MAVPLVSAITNVEPVKVALVIPLVGLVKTTFAPERAHVPPSLATCCCGAPPLITTLTAMVWDQVPPLVPVISSAVTLIFQSPL